MPSASDAVIFDGVGTGDSPCTIAANAVCLSMVCGGYTNTITHNAVTLTVSGSITFVAGMTYTTVGISVIEMDATGTFTSAGKEPYKFESNANGGTVTLGDNLTIQDLFTHTDGTLVTDGGGGSLTHAWGRFASSNSNVRTVTLGDSSISFNSTGVAWNTTTSTNLTMNAGTSTLTFTGAGAYIGPHTTTLNNVVITGGGTKRLVYGGGTPTFANLTITGTAAKTDLVEVQGNFTVTGIWTIAGNSATNRPLIYSNGLGTARTITNTGATMTWSNVDFMDIALRDAFDASAITGGSGDCLGNSNITFTTPAAQTWQTAAGGNWSDSGNWTSRVPLPQDDCDLGIAYNSGITVTVDMPRLGADVDWTGATDAGTDPVFRISTHNGEFYGSLTLISGISVNFGIRSMFFRGRSSHTITSAGKIFVKAEFFAVGGTYTLADAFIASSTTTLTNGTLDTAGFNLTAGTFLSTNTNTRTLDIEDSTITVNSGGATTQWNLSTTTNLTFIVTNSTIVCGLATANTQFRGGTVTYNDISITVGTGTMRFSHAFTFNNMTMSAVGARTVIFDNNTTFTMTGSNFLTGTAGNVVTIVSNSGGSQATLSKASGEISVDYLDLTDSNATGGADWYAGANSADSSNNDGWIFTAPPGGAAVPLRALMGLGT